MDRNTEEKILKFLNPETTSILAKIAISLSIIPIVSLVLGIIALFNIKADPLLKGKNIAIIAIIINIIVSIVIGGFIFHELNKEFHTKCNVSGNIGCNSERIYLTNNPNQNLFLDALFYNSNNDKITIVDIVIEGIDGLLDCDTVVSDYIHNRNYKVSKKENIGIGVPAKSIFGIKLFETNTCKVKNLKSDSIQKIKLKLQYFEDNKDKNLIWTTINITTKVTDKPKPWANEDMRVTPTGTKITVN